jgi:cytochrome c556
MTKTFVRVAFTAAAAAGVFVVLGTAPTTAQEKGLTIKDIMKAGHAGADALMTQAKNAAKDGKWDAAVAAAKSLDSNAALLHKATPSKGGADSWEKLAGGYHKNTTALLAAAEKKDAPGVSKAAGAIGASCKTCHSTHKGK